MKNTFLITGVLAVLVSCDGSSQSALNISYPDNYKTKTECSLLAISDCRELSNLTRLFDLNKRFAEDVPTLEIALPEYKAESVVIDNALEDEKNPASHYGDITERLEVSFRYYLCRAVDDAEKNQKDKSLSSLNEALELDQILSELLDYNALAHHYVDGRLAASQAVRRICKMHPDLASRVLELKSWKNFRDRYFDHDFVRYLNTRIIYTRNVDGLKNKVFRSALEKLLNELSLQNGLISEVGLDGYKWMSTQDNVFIKSQCLVYWVLVEDYCQRQLVDAYLNAVSLKASTGSYPTYESVLDANDQEIKLRHEGDSDEIHLYYDLPNTIYGKFSAVLEDHIPMKDQLALGESAAKN